MKTFIDTKLLKKISSHDVREGSFIENHHQVVFSWASLLEYLDLGGLFKTFPKFDEKNALFSILNSSLELEKDLVIELYDKIFIECLTQIQAMPEINSNFLLEKIKEKKEIKLFNSALDYYVKNLVENPYTAIHDLILYLAFDRVCICIAILFEKITSQTTTVAILKECLIESFQHITKDGKSSPGFFRLVEALYAYQMREEYLQNYSDSEWLLLCQTVSALKPREVLIDLSYIDAVIVEISKIETKEPIVIFTMDSKEIVESRLALASYIMKKLQLEIPEWDYTFSPFNIFYL